MSSEHQHEERHPVTDPVLLKDFINGVHNFWNHLPEEQQAHAAYKLVNDALGGNWGPWLREALEARLTTEVKATEEEYPVITISRQHLTKKGFNEEEIKALDEGDLRRVAEKMKGYYELGEFWDDLAHAAVQVLNEKPGNPLDETPSP